MRRERLAGAWEAAVPVRPFAAGRVPERGRRGPAVLIADDDADARHILGELLAHRGYVTLAAASGTDALLLARSIAPAVVVAELYLPAGELPCLVHAMRADAVLQRVPIVVHTAFALPADYDWAAEARVDDFLRKPTRLADVLAAILRVAGPARARGGRH